jgi:hypothetical protein
VYQYCKENKEFAELVESYTMSRMPYIEGGIQMIFELHCERFLKSISITADGFVLGCGEEISCPNYDRLAIDNVKRSSLEDIIQKGKEYAVDFIKDHKTYACYHCEAKKYL